MMKMATGEGSPSGRVPGRAPERFLVATEACGSETPDLLFASMFLGYMRIYRRKKSVGGVSRGPRDRGRALGGATLVTASVTSWSRVQVSWITFGEKITFPKVSFCLDSV